MNNKKEENEQNQNKNISHVSRLILENMENYIPLYVDNLKTQAKIMKFFLDKNDPARKITLYICLRVVAKMYGFRDWVEISKRFKTEKFIMAKLPNDTFEAKWDIYGKPSERSF